MSSQGEAGRILIVDDEEAMRVFMRRSLEREGYDVTVAADGEEALRAAEGASFDLVITDLAMPGMTGMELLAELRRRRPGTVVIVMTGYGSISSAVQALKGGAVDYVTKPFEREEILRAVQAVLQASQLRAENRLLKRLLEEGRRFEGLVGSSAAMRSLYSRIEQVAARDGVALIHGESGCGKELVARAIHARSSRCAGPFVAFHAASMPAGLVAAELFGSTEGAFTGARERPGAARRASGGTLFLDEIGEIPLDVQPALLRLLQSGEVTALGSTRTESVDLRVVAATHRDLPSLVESGRFRQDLFFRLNVFPIEVPPLVRHREDIPDLIRHFLAIHGGEGLRLDLEAAAHLERHRWPGNVRELENVIVRMVALANGETLGVELLPEEIRNAGTEAPAGEEVAGFKEAVAAFERRFLDRLLAQHGGNISEAARHTGLSRPTLHAKITQHRLDPDRYR